MSEDVAIVGDCKGVAMNAQLGGHTNTDERSVPNCKYGLIKLFAIYIGRIFAFVQETHRAAQYEGMVSSIHVWTNNTLWNVKTLLTPN